MAVNRAIYCKSCGEPSFGTLPVLKGTGCKYCGKELYKNWSRKKP